MLMARPLLALLGVGFAIGTPLEPRAVQDPAPNTNLNTKTPSSGNGIPGPLSQDVPLWSALAALPVAWWAGRRTLVPKVARLEKDLQATQPRALSDAISNMSPDELRGEVQLLREEISWAKNGRVRLEEIHFELDGHRMTLNHWEDYLLRVGECKGDKIRLMVRFFSVSTTFGPRSLFCSLTRTHIHRQSERLLGRNLPIPFPFVFTGHKQLIYNILPAIPSPSRSSSSPRTPRCLVTG